MHPRIQRIVNRLIVDGTSLGCCILDLDAVGVSCRFVWSSWLGNKAFVTSTCVTLLVGKCWEKKFFLV